MTDHTGEWRANRALCSRMGRTFHVLSPLPRFARNAIALTALPLLATLSACGSGETNSAADAGAVWDGATSESDAAAYADAAVNYDAEPSPDAGPQCGDGVVEGDEVCDDGEENSDDWALAPHCNANCSGLAPHCGDAMTDAPEESCDDGANNADEWAPDPHCNATCTGQAPLCDAPEETGAVIPHPGVSYPAENLHSDEKAVLGKILFWEQQLSADDTVACGTCHTGSAGGSDSRAGLALHPGADGQDETGDDVLGSMGIRRCEMIEGVPTPKTDAVFGDNVQVTDRKTPSFLDAMFAPTLFGDGRALDAFVDPDTGLVVIPTGGALESQALAPILSPVEMSCEGRTFADVTTKLEATPPLDLATDLPPDIANAICKYPSYPALFEAAFGDSSITAVRIAMAIATYERTLVSDQAPYDRFVDPVSPDLTALTANQQQGLALFEGAAGCSECHLTSRPNPQAPANFSNQDFHNLGFIDFESQLFPDLGLARTTGLAEDEGKFRTSTLRNVGLREASLLHTGLGSSLTDVMNAYNNPGVPPGPDSTTDERMVPLGLSGEDIGKIVDFMRVGLTDPRVASESFPFDHPTLFEP